MDIEGQQATRERKEQTKKETEEVINRRQRIHKREHIHDKETYMYIYTHIFIYD